MPTKTNPRKTTAKNKSSFGLIGSSGKSSLILGHGPGISKAVLAFVFLFVAIGGYLIYNASRASSSAELQSLMTGSGGPFCLDDHGDGGPGSVIDAWPCNGSPAQNYYYSSNEEIHVGTGCIGVQGASASSWYGSVVMVNCSPTPWGAAWTISGDTILNNHADTKGGSYCLDIKGAVPKGALDIYPCNGGYNQDWVNSVFTGSGGGTGGSSTPTPRPVSSCYDKTLQLGSRSQCVTDAQIIISFGAGDHSMVVNGYFDAPTLSDVELFQKIAVSGNGVNVYPIPVTGKIDVATWSKLCTVGMRIATSSARVESPPLTGPYYNVRNAAVAAGCPN